MTMLDSLRSRAWMRAANRVGPGLSLDGKPSISNRGLLEIGARVYLCSRPVQSHLDVRDGGRLQIGDDVSIGQGAAISAHGFIRIGDGCRLGAFVVIADSDFHVPGDDEATPEISPVLIGRDVELGNRVTVLRGAQIGDGASVAAGSVVSGPVSAGARVMGVPARNVSERGTQAAAQALEERVPLVIQRALGLRSPPPLQAGPAQIAEWTSLGTLKVLLALEEEFAVSLPEEEVATARAVCDLVAMVEAARARND